MHRLGVLSRGIPAVALDLQPVDCGLAGADFFGYFAAEAGAKSRENIVISNK